ncbi:MAG: hypothetical protein NW205_10305 [Hyphomicrobiaceae bacterium]|nr:hypothetical protein [Hyphomicrobiaceae bacterium]
MTPSHVAFRAEVLTALAILSVLAGALTLSRPCTAADSWGLPNEKIVVLKGTVVDIACHLKGDCPANCGDGKRQLGLVTDDGKLRPVVKGGTDFAGAHRDLVSSCGKQIEADGLLIENPAMTVFFAQKLRASPQAAWQDTNAFLSHWKARYGETKEWMRDDPAVREKLAITGVLGIPGLAPPKP